jgi:protein-L-isoaspartate O-methyltransferase
MQEPRCTLPDYSQLPLYIQARGWPTGLECFAQQRVELGYNVSTDLYPRHAAWKGLLSYEHRERALVVERGCGSVALTLARDFGCVDAIYPDECLIDAVRARVEYLGQTNIAASRELAPPQNAYDAIAVCGLTADELTPAIIDTLASALRPHGSMYFAVEIPRPRCLYDCSSVRRILKLLRTRFPRVQPFRYIGSIVRATELQLMGARQQSAKKRIAGWLTAYRGGAIGIVVSNESSGPSLFEQILAAVSPGLQIERYVFAHPIGFSLIARDRRRDRRFIVRMPMEERAVVRAHVNSDITAELHGHDLPFAVPVFVSRGEVHGQPFFAEAMLDGSTVDRIELCTPRVYGRVARAGVRAITEFQCSLAEHVKFTPAILDRVVSPILTAAEEALAGHTGSHLLPDINAYVTASLDGRCLPLVRTHGDYTFDNILLDREKKSVTGVFDWDLAQRRGMPLLDLFYFLVAMNRACTNRTFPPIFTEVLRTGFARLEQSLIKDYCRTLDVPEDLQNALFILCWLHHVGVREYRAERYLYLKTYWTETMEAAAAIAADTGVARQQCLT